MDRPARLSAARGAGLAAMALLTFAGLSLAGSSRAGAAGSEQIQIRGVLSGIAIGSGDESPTPGTLTVGTQHVSVPSELLIEFPGDAITLQQLFDRAPAVCRASKESGLLRTSRCGKPRRDPHADTPAWTAERDRTPRTSLDPDPTDEVPETAVRLIATQQPGGALVATSIALGWDDRSVRGAITFVNEDEGYVRIGGMFGADEGGAIVRINDPLGQQSIQRGRGCGSEGNCSPDVRLKANTLKPTVRFSSGVMACIPGGLGGACDPVARAAARAAAGGLGSGVMLPILKGDHVTTAGGFVVVDGVRVLFAHTLVDDSQP